MRQILYTILTLFVLTGTAASWQAAGQVREDRMYRIVSPSGLAIDNRLNPDNLGNLFLSPVDRKDKGQLWRLVKYADAGVIQKIRRNGVLLKEEYRDNGIYVEAYVPLELTNLFGSETI